MRYTLLAALVLPSVFARVIIHKVDADAADAAASSSSSVIIPTRDLEGNYLYEVPVDIINHSKSDVPSPSTAPTLKRLQEKVEISHSDFYFSQTDSYVVPDLSTVEPGSPYVRPYPNFPDINA